MTKFILGFGIGVGLGVIFAPLKGEEMRARLTEKVKEVVDSPRKKAVELAEAGKEKARELGKKIGRPTGDAATEAVKQTVGEKSA